MNDWGQGYVTDVDYTHGFYRDLAPGFLRLLCRLQGVAEPPGPLTYLELGCGQGFALNALAAANPDDRFVGVDFMPSQIVGARRLAERAELDNVTFLERSFDELVDRDDLPACDIIVLHGVYSWVGPAQREAIRKIILRHLKAGGLVYLSYNCMVGWAQFLPFQRLLRDLAVSRGGVEAATETFGRIRELAATNIGYFADNAAIKALLTDLEKRDARYLAHEYLNGNWEPLYFHDVDRELRSCRLSFIGSASPADNVPKFAAAPEAAALQQSERDPALRELVKDIALGRRFRKDVYQRGPVRLDAGERGEALADTVFALTKPRGSIPLKAPVPLGTLELRRPVYAAIFDALDLGPRTLGAIAGGPDGLHEVVTVLMQTGAIHPCVAPGVAGGAAARLNRAITETSEDRQRFGFVASPVIGTAIPVPAAMRSVLSICLSTPDLEDLEIAEQVKAAANREPVPDSENELSAADIGQQRRSWRQLGIIS
ncbi:Methyltransferase domain-containing protein [Bosea sp. CRIB-10]|uniref:class I SAM-dependent methyltransferase n=1 Tax=Bosea sp. CRIB-10 TaxID=378404 RepID=UPI0008E07314|nr:class I SAM-dependent methyltransferase [Bosea sp. CRIB-10]SFD64413.1 Methyltransferase domain-containing protein [Bosea sp. CRIB-10]